ncbi:MAG: hypothetical protein C5B49_09190 [Bdellovibrio sp.]|nr:MAG: hypothetical protein C5B49_09190 [Bdellovibrio sp.]
MNMFFADNSLTLRFRVVRALVVVMSVTFGSICLAQTAVVIIDMQDHHWEQDHPLFKKKRHMKPENQEIIKKVQRRQVELIEMAKRLRLPIVTLEYVDCGDTCKAIKDAIGTYRDTKPLVKTWNGMFDPRAGIAEELDTYLKSRNVSQLIVGGCNGRWCVKSSIEGALDKGYRVYTDAEAVADFYNDEFEHPYYYEEGQIKVPQNNQGFNQLSNIRGLGDLNADSDPSKISMSRFGSRLAAANTIWTGFGVIAGRIIEMKKEDFIDQVVQKTANQECPIKSILGHTLGEPQLFEQLHQYGFAEREKILRDCEKKGYDVDFTNYSGFFRNLSPMKDGQVTCNSNAIQILEKDQTVTRIVFGSNGEMIRIFVQKPQSVGPQLVLYTKNNEIEYRGASSEHSNGKEPFLNFVRRHNSSYYWNPDEYGNLDGKTEQDTPRTPWGRFVRSDVDLKRYGFNLLRIKMLLSTQKDSQLTFQKTCQFLKDHAVWAYAGPSRGKVRVVKASGFR